MLSFGSQNLTEVALRPEGSLGKWGSLVFPARCFVEPQCPTVDTIWNPAQWGCGQEPSARQAPLGQWAHAVLSSCFSFVAALAPPSHFLFGRPPAARPMSSVPVLCSSRLLPPPAPLASFGMPGFCFWQESAVAVPVVGAVSRQLVGRWSRGLCGTPETGQCGGLATAGTRGGLHCRRLEAAGEVWA